MFTSHVFYSLPGLVVIQGWNFAMIEQAHKKNQRYKVRRQRRS